MKEYITSRSNRHIVDAVKLKNKKYRDQTGLYCFEGNKLFIEALNSGVELCSVFFTEKSYNNLANLLDTLDCPLYTVTDNVYEKLTFDTAPDGVFCVAKRGCDRNSPCGKRFILSSVRDPGNLGTCIRSARAFCIDELILHDCADVYNSKVIRSSMGSFFRQHITHTDDIFATINRLYSDGYTVYATALNDRSIPLDQIKTDSKTVFIVGNEGHGISEEVIDACRGSVIIPMPGDTESLNASVAASILIWELSKT